MSPFLFPELILSETTGIFRSWPDGRTCVSSFGMAIDAEWDRPPVRVPASLLFSSDEERNLPFWLYWTAKEAQYKCRPRNLPFVPADYPVKDVQELPPGKKGILRLFLWSNGMTLLAQFSDLIPRFTDSRNLSPMWISLAGTFDSCRHCVPAPVFIRKVNRDLTIRPIPWKTPDREPEWQMTPDFPMTPGEM